MIERRKEKKKERRAKYVSYFLLFMVTLGFHYFTEGKSKSRNLASVIIQPMEHSIYITPRTAHIISDIYDMSICEKYYRANEACNRILQSFTQCSEKLI